MGQIGRIRKSHPVFRIPAAVIPGSIQDSLRHKLGCLQQTPLCRFQYGTGRAVQIRRFVDHPLVTAGKDATFSRARGRSLFQNLACCRMARLHFETAPRKRRSSSEKINHQGILGTLLATDRFHFDCDQLISYVSCIIYLTELLAILPHQLLNDENLELLSILVCRNNGNLLLHLAMACEIGEDINRLAIIRLLRRVGANPDAADDNGDRPHHFLAWFNPTDEAAARLLLNAGAFLGRLNNEGRTAADLWQESQGLDENVDATATDMPSWLRDYDQVPKLKLQCGRVIRSHRVPYLRLPLSLRNFVEMRPEGNEDASLDAA